MPFNISKHHATGQALTEYALIGSLVALVSLGGLLAFSGTLKDMFQRFQSTMSSGQRQSASAGNAISAPQQSSLGPNPGQLSGMGTEALQAKTKDIIQNYPTDIKEAVHTLGANGTVHMLADNILAQANKSLAAGKITPEQYNNLISLSNQGHELAEMMQLVDTAVLTNQSITFQGKEYSIQEFGQIMGYVNTTDPSQNLMKTPAIGEVQDFITTYNALVQDGTLQDPENQKMVGDLVTQIVSIHQVASVTIDKVFTGSLPPEKLNAERASGAIDVRSSDICNIGSGEDQGSKCSS
jgi:Flp pilus assembly pilin Flp